jgi:CRISPR/Cas system CMR subunit Cmr6 (Cas7 group RAMP superfamily)
LIQIQHFITANNIHSITNQNGNLVINFNTTTNNTPPPQVIEQTQLSEKNSTMDNEQKTMWRKFKEYLTKTNKNKIDKQELEQEIQKLKNNSETQEPTSKAPLIIGGIVVGATLIIGLIFILRNRKKTKKL